MMKKFILLSGFVLLACTAPTQAQTPALATVVATCGTPPSTYTAGQQRPILQNTSGNQCTASSATISGTVSTNVAQVNGQTVNVGAGAAGTGTQRVTTSTDSTIGTVTNPVGMKGADGSAIASASNPLPSLSVPSSSSTAGVAAVSSSAIAANTVIKASAGNLYSFQVSADSTLAGAAWWIMIYNATSAPADGAITPSKCYALPSGTTAFSAGFNQPVYFSSGITIGVSTTGCFTKTESIHAFISGDAQ